MIKLVDLLEVTISKQQDPVMIKIVISDNNDNTLQDEKKRNEVFRVLERNLKTQQFGKLSYSVQDIMDGIKYYPQTNKIVGNFPKSVFVHPGKAYKINYHSTLNTDKCRFKDELQKISKTLEINQKK